MTRWNKGSDFIERLLDIGHLERVPADANTVSALIDTARRHISSATETQKGPRRGP